MGSGLEAVVLGAGAFDCWGATAGAEPGGGYFFGAVETAGVTSSGATALGADGFWEIGAVAGAEVVGALVEAVGAADAPRAGGVTIVSRGSLVGLAFAG